MQTNRVTDIIRMDHIWFRSQFAALEEPAADERPIVVSIEPHPREIVDNIVAKLGIAEAATPI